MRLRHDYNEKMLVQIARQSGGGQISRDVSFLRTVVFHSGNKEYIEYVPNTCFLIGYIRVTAKDLRIIGIAVTKENQHKGIARLLLCRAIVYARQNRLEYIRTRSLDGVDFYQRFGFNITGIKENDYLLEYKI